MDILLSIWVIEGIAISVLHSTPRIAVARGLDATRSTPLQCWHRLGACRNPVLSKGILQYGVRCSIFKQRLQPIERFQRAARRQLVGAHRGERRLDRGG